MTIPPTPTGAVAAGPRGDEIQIIRRFHAPIEDVWAAVTESPRLERWIGRWEGHPASGRVRFFMTAEGEDVPAEEIEIVECAPPHRLALDTTAQTPEGAQHWRLRVELSHDAGVTTLLFAQVLVDDLASVGPGWEYYLDRLAATLDGRDVGSVAWDDYFPAMSAYYDGLSVTSE
jgi:uncharacterized protein YndB with AHSA1/START domain